MNLINEIENKTIKNDVLKFLETYGFKGLQEAMDSYVNMQQIYICKTRAATSKIYICDINYVEVHTHLITIHTAHANYEKYGSLNKEMEILSKYGFVKCSQNCIVPLTKIRTVTYDDVILLDGTKIGLSKRYASKVLLEFRFFK